MDERHTHTKPLWLYQSIIMWKVIPFQSTSIHNIHNIHTCIWISISNLCVNLPHAFAAPASKAIAHCSKDTLLDLLGISWLRWCVKNTWLETTKSSRGISTTTTKERSPSLGGLHIVTKILWSCGRLDVGPEIVRCCEYEDVLERAMRIGRGIDLSRDWMQHEVMTCMVVIA